MSLFIACKVADFLDTYDPLKTVQIHKFDPKKHRYVGVMNFQVQQEDVVTIQAIATMVLRLVTPLVAIPDSQQLIALAEDLSLICASEIGKSSSVGINKYLTKSRGDQRRYFLGGFLLYHLWMRTGQTLKNFGFVAVYPHESPPTMGSTHGAPSGQQQNGQFTPMYTTANLESKIMNDMTGQYRLPVYPTGHSHAAMHPFYGDVLASTAIAGTNGGLSFDFLGAL